MLVLLVPLLVAQLPPSHCGPKEQVVFSCAVKKKVLSVCAGPATGKPQWVQYRFGAPGKPELVFPVEQESSLGRFRFEERTLLTGTSRVLAFVNAGTSYEVFFQDGKDAGGGVVVTKGTARPVTVTCSGDPTERWDEVLFAFTKGDAAAAGLAERCRSAAVGYSNRALAEAKGQLDGVQQGELFEAVATLCAAGWSDTAAACVAANKGPCVSLSAEQAAALEAKHLELAPP